MTDKVRKHPNSGELYTPINEQFYELLEQMHREYGNWRIVAWKADVRLKILRNLRKGKRKTISMTLLDRMITSSGVGNLADFTFFTPDDLVRLGIWKEVYYVEGNKRIQGDKVTEAPKMSRRERELIGRKKQRARLARAKREARRRGDIW